MIQAIHPRTGELSEVIFTYVTTHREIVGLRFGKTMWVLRYRFTYNPNIKFWQPILLLNGQPPKRRADFGLPEIYAAAEVVLGRKLTPDEETNLLADKYPEFRQLLHLDGQHWDAQYNDLTPQQISEAIVRTQQRLGINVVCHTHQATEPIPKGGSVDDHKSNQCGGGRRVIRSTNAFS